MGVCVLACKRIAFRMFTCTARNERMLTPFDLHVSVWAICGWVFVTDFVETFVAARPEKNTAYTAHKHCVAHIIADRRTSDTVCFVDCVYILCIFDQMGLSVYICE